jgi:hypothetical protein
VKRLIAMWVLAAASASSLGQMMTGGPMATPAYFPLVDGAHYDYMYTRGPWASSTVTLHAGQTWAGVTGLTAMHTAYVCRSGVACAPGASDFFRMDPDGMRYFGGTGADPTGTHFFMTSYPSPEWVLNNPVMPGTMMGGPGGGYGGAEMWQAGVTGTNSMMGTDSHMSSYRALAGTFPGALHVREDRGSGYTRDVWYASGIGIVMMSDAAGSAVLTGYSIPSGPGQPGSGADPLAFTPTIGLWWSPDEPGTGYNFQVQHGVLVATIYSYTSAGDPIWYLATGPLSNAGSGVAVTATLDRYRGGQCVTCTYQPPGLAGNDGSLTITFSSPASANVQFPGGRRAAVRPGSW